MNVKKLYILSSLTLGLLALAGILALLGAWRGGAAVVHALGSIRYVAPTGSCGSGVTPCYSSVQAAVDAATPDDEIRVAAGIYTDIHARQGITQVVYLSKTVTVRGGYTTTNWTTPHPITQPTTLDAGGQGRVLYITGNISPTIAGLRLTGGDSAGLGGGPAGYDAGGGVYIITATATLSGNDVSGNTANFSGGGLYLHDSDATLSGNDVSGNTTARYGGGLYLSDSDATLSGNSVMSNTANLHGGGLYLFQGDNATLSGNTVMSNTANSRGGGLRLYLSDATLSGNSVMSNTANSRGGGLCLWLSDATLDNNFVADNRTSGQGAGLYVAGSSPHLRHNTLARNTGGDGSGVYITDHIGIYYSTVALTNTILVSHTIGISVAAGSTATLEGTLWGSGDWANGTDWGGEGNILTGTVDIWGDPAFVDPGAGDYHIGPTSAAVDAGVDAGVTEDIDGDARPVGDKPDIGADEFAIKIYLPLVMRNYP